MSEHRKIPLHHRGIDLLVWTSPFLGLEFFFPLAVLFAYPKNLHLRQSAFASLFLQIFVILLFYPLLLLSLSNPVYEIYASSLILLTFVILIPVFFIMAMVLYFKQRNYFLRKKRNHAKITKKRYLLLVLSLTAGMIWYFNLKNEAMLKYEPVNFLSGVTLYTLLIVFGTIQSLSGGRMHKTLRKYWLRTEKHKRELLSASASAKKIAIKREMLLPGWGHISLGNYWKGFPVLFLYLLTILFLGVFLSGYIDPVFGINFMGTLGLKFGTGDKNYFLYADKPVFLLFLLFLLLIYLYAYYSVKKEISFRDKNQLRSGFLNNIPFSVLIHFIFFTLVFLIPVTLRRNSTQQQKKNIPPPQFYSIETEIPDNIKDLNGGIISGKQETKDKGVTTQDKKISETGVIKGKTAVKKGKPVPATYSNYISAKMRAPGFFTDYWAKAPYPYSSVVSYTITPEGEIINIQIIEPSPYPEQDRLTLELIESMSPLLPYPENKGDIRVTELFWNGPIDPSRMPTQTQSEMVRMFDGRYLEEDF